VVRKERRKDIVDFLRFFCIFLIPKCQPKF